MRGQWTVLKSVQPAHSSSQKVTFLSLLTTTTTTTTTTTSSRFFFRITTLGHIPIGMQNRIFGVCW